MSKSTFRDWTLTKLDKRFSLTQVRHQVTLDAWLNAKADISDFEEQILFILKERAIFYIDSWNEQEYALNFIGQIFSLVDFTNDRFNAFAERFLSGTIDGETISGNPDGMIASGWREPEIPYFCLQEYKRERDPDGDPAGQCLAAMLVAQTLNENQMPVYGCYILGRNWFFMILEDKRYAISNSYTVTQDQIFDIFRILKSLKAIILTLIQ